MGGSMPHSLGGNESRQRKAQRLAPPRGEAKRPGGPSESEPGDDAGDAVAVSLRTSDSGDQSSDSGDQSDEQRRILRKAAGASFIGNFIEWFDYASYGYLAAVIGSVFFPKSDETAQLLSAFAIFALSFVLRPIGAVVWGAWGDRYGRRWALSWSILIMSGSTFLIGVLPGYSAIGIFAPLALFLLRMIQGFSASGEYAGAGTFLAEYAPPKHRGLYTSLVPASTAAGLLFGNVIVMPLQGFLDEADMHSWGWRIPFLLAGPLGLIGRYIRIHLEDSPVFNEMSQKAEKKSKHRVPLKTLLRSHRKRVAITFGVACLNAVAFYLLLTYMPTYFEKQLGIEATHAEAISAGTLAVYIVAIFFMGKISDMFGRRRMLVGACLAFIVLSIPLFWVMEQGNVVMIVAAEAVFALILTANDGTLATFLAESFPTEVRYSGFALSFNSANALVGGTAPLVATWLIKVTGTAIAPAFYLTCISVLALGAMCASRSIARESASLAVENEA